MNIKTIFEWAELFKEEITNGGSKSDVVQLLEDYKTEQLALCVVSSSCADKEKQAYEKGWEDGAKVGADDISSRV